MALVDFVDSQPEDLAGHAYTAWEYIPGIGKVNSTFITNVLNNHSSWALDLFIAVLRMTTNTLRSITIGNFTDEFLSPRGNIWQTATYKNDLRVIQYAVKKLNEIVSRIEAAVSSENLLIVAASFQGLTQSMVSYAAANEGTKNEKAALQPMREWLDSVDQFAREEDLD
ncbi:hypothetical protein F5B22DRAFT_652040 [Xylaria bambusicola]|uniref:uncharacterized protein n=1 Tax=Xylaria bambusicola TaxID=326684 RepID=UPI002008CA70|nr:uncharacterized protein F5B22DRAFT_652040 [Xylaria bambusicola]KAI0505124.1 hypothetical protein F5B22DRAFT_652040 [Xylaria bambusicola]